MSIAEQNKVAAAWYPDRTNPGQLRWWNGSDWTSDVRPLTDPPVVASTPEVVVVDPRHGLHAVAKPAEGFGHASAQQLRSWPPPLPEQRNEIPAPVNQVPRNWAANSSVDAIRGWMAKSAEPVQFVPSLSSIDAAPPVIDARAAPLAISAPAVPLAISALPAMAAPPATALPAMAAPPATALPAMAAPAQVAAPAAIEELPETFSFANWRPAAAIEIGTGIGQLSTSYGVPPDFAQEFQPQQRSALTRRQLRELMGGPLTRDVDKG